MAKITFLPSKKTLNVEPKTNLMNAIIEAQLPIGSSCGGEGICAKCIVKVIKGNENLSKPNANEKKLIQREKLNPTTRVSCQIKVLGDVEITTGYW
ncbi:MAG: (2Fe-2S)-binding protein [Oligoflexia bacterium]|nr:(2Fe-2S)-binding protein [Oligoflexia bacterium]